MPKIAYFINQYPMVSHSFIRREIQALDKQGLEVTRIAIRSDLNQLQDANDIEEFHKTILLSKQGAMGISTAVLKSLAFSPIAFLAGISSAISLTKKSNLGFIKHLIYFLEACVLKDICDKNGISHIHAHFGTNSTAITLLLKKLGGPTFSFTVHGPEEFDKPEALSISDKIHHATFVAAISSFGRSQLYRWSSPSDWKKIAIIRCGIEPNDYEQIPKISEVQNNQLVCVGRLCEQKAQLLLVDAVAELLEQGTRLELVLAGDGPMREEIEERIKSHGVEQFVRITGWLSGQEVQGAINHSSVLILPSFAEGLPVVIMEAMASKRFALSTYIAGIPELITDGDNGFLVPAGDKEKLKESLTKILKLSLKEKQILGSKAQGQVFKLHDVNVSAEKLKRLLLS